MGVLQIKLFIVDYLCVFLDVFLELLTNFSELVVLPVPAETELLVFVTEVEDIVMQIGQEGSEIVGSLLFRVV